MLKKKTTEKRKTSVLVHTQKRKVQPCDAEIVHVSFYNIYFNKKYFYRIDGGTWYTMKSCSFTLISIIAFVTKFLYNVKETTELFIKNVARLR